MIKKDRRFQYNACKDLLYSELNIRLALLNVTLLTKFLFCFFNLLFFIILTISGFEKGTPIVEFKSSKKNGGKLLVINGIRFFRNRQRNGKQYWKCSFYYRSKCPTIAILNEENRDIKIIHDHCHSASSTPLK